MNGRKRISAVFYRNDAGAEPVRQWVKGLSKDDRFRIGTDLKTVELGWPIGTAAGDSWEMDDEAQACGLEAR